MPYHVSKAEFDRLVEAAMRELPTPFAAILEEISIQVRDEPSAKDLSAARVEPGGLLLGLYQGVPRTERGDPPPMIHPDVIYLFQRNIERICSTPQGLLNQVRTTLLHEIGHHFGMNELDLTDLGYG